MKLVRMLVVSLTFLFFLSACQPAQEKVTRLSIGETYEDMKLLKLVDDSHFVAMDNQARYQTEEELQEFQNSQEHPNLYHPNILFWEGTYEKVDDDYKFTSKRSVYVEFKNVKNVKQKIIASKNIVDDSNQEAYFMLIKDEEGYHLKNSFNVYLRKSQESLPNSVDDFLAQYKYEPEELE